MKKIILCLLLAISACKIYGSPIFKGEVNLEPDGCKKLKSCITKGDLYFTDTNGLGWYAPKGTKTDGATIPESIEEAVRLIIGDRYDPIIMKAVVLHDHYCREHVRTWYQTNRMFYDALIASGVNRTRAKLMYAGVLVGSNIWVYKKIGRACPSGLKSAECIYENPLSITTKSTYGMTKNPQEYGEDFKVLEEMVKLNNDISLDELDQTAATLRIGVSDAINNKDVLPSNSDGEVM